MLALIADDDPDIRQLIAIALTRTRDWKVVSAGTGRDALTIAARELPDVVLVDRRLPDGDGLEILSALRKSAETAHIPIILISALPPDGALPPGVIGFIPKPFDPISLPSRIRAMLKIP